ncbi:C10 family peptidase [uncultured Bacteroides sp.]|uniref:C10 family peptidase n=1 Tax=uncultured Bacteroides sp. TaxID=162156 RepID=UPI002AA685B2|nr:C10 family peptidase [uncultured Bacteroides sp.]
MKKVLLFITFFLFLLTNVFALPRTSSEAFSVAKLFHQKSNSSIKLMSTETTALKLAYTCTDGIATRSTTEKAYYYVFNRGNNSGFIIVSGDDRAKEVLGYSDTGSFNINSLPSNFASWLGFYQNEMKALMEQPEETTVTSTTLLSSSTNVATRQTSYAASITPLLGNIKWDQGAPYNNLCPLINDTTRSVTGCVATAMAQVMRYYKWPVKGAGSHTYTTSSLNKSLTADFSNTTYDWANMTETYSSSSTDTQKTAVATLMFHAGVAVEMNYGESSSASSIDMAKALFTYFGYDSNLQSYQRDYYSSSEWIDMIKTELNASRPVLYAGQASDGGHQFVCDGYDSNGLFHFNWGWSGSSDGYFELSVLNPGSFGIGGTSGGFNTSQNIVIGIQKPNSSSTAAPYQLCIYKPLTTAASSISRTSLFSISMTLYNYGVNSFGGSLGIALYNNSGFVKLLNSTNVSSLGSYYGYTNPNFPKNLAIPADVADGNYKLCCVFKPSGQTDWQIMRGKIGIPNYLNVALTSANINISTPDAYPKLTINSLTATGNLYNNKAGRFSLSITNTGAEYNSNIVLKLVAVDNSATSQTVCTNPVNIPSGETKIFDFTDDITAAPGQYYLTAYYDSQNDRSNLSYTSFANPLTVTVLAKPTETPALTLTSKISFPSSSSVGKSNAVLTAHIKNTGGYFDNNVIAFVFPLTPGLSLTYIGYQKILLDKNEERTITFSGNINLDPSSYRVVVYYWDTVINDWSRFNPTTFSLIPFTLVNDATGIEETTLGKLTLYPNPATDKLFLQSEGLVKSIRIMDISGKQVLLMKPETSGEITIPVARLSAGTYILQSETETGIKVSKFIKR